MFLLGFESQACKKTKLNFFSKCVRFLHRHTYSVDPKRITLPLYSVLLLYYKGTKLTVKVYVLLKNFFFQVTNTFLLQNRTLWYPSASSFLHNNVYWTVFNRRKLCILVIFPVTVISISSYVLAWIIYRRHTEMSIYDIT